MTQTPPKLMGLLRGAATSWLFWIGLLIRLIALPLPGSKYLNDLFLPFLDQAVISAVMSPVGVGSTGSWLMPWNEMSPQNFPYGTFLYAVLFIPKLMGYLIFGELALGHTSLAFALVKAPLLFFDGFCLYLLATCTRFQRRNLLVYYWLNPVLFFITYIHGQLDVVSVTMCVAALVYLARGQTIASALFMAAATLSKFHVIVALPLIAAFIWNRSFPKLAVRQLLLWMAVFIAVVAVGFFPLRGSLGYVTASSPEAMRIFAAKFDLGQGHYLYVGIVGLLIVIGRLAMASEITARGLTVGAALIFSVLVLITDPMPGWYFWFMPFVALYFSTVATPVAVLFWALCGFYFAYFVPIYLLEIPVSPMMSSLALAGMQSALAGIVAVLWGDLARELPLSGRTRPLILGVAGDSGAGKDRFSGLMCNIFGARRTLVVAGDDYHKWERGSTRWDDYTHLSPRANHLSDMARHTADLSSWQAIAQPHYQHGTGKFTSPRLTTPKRTIVVQGLHSLYYRGMRDMYDLSIFLAPEENLRTWWKVARDVHERGYDPTRVLENIASRRGDSERHINPQKNFSDWVIEYYVRGEFDLESAIRGEKPLIGVRHRVWNDAPVDALVEALRNTGGVTIDFSLSEDNFEQVVIRIEGDPSSAEIGGIAENLFPNLRTLTRSWRAPEWESGYDGITQLMSLVLVSGRFERARHALD